MRVAQVKIGQQTKVLELDSTFRPQTRHPARSIPDFLPTMSADEIAPRNAVYKWLAGTKISAVLPQGETQNIVCLPHTATLREAIQVRSSFDFFC
jgi:hypothetical protein